jgi:hypothetical protein
MSVKPELIIDIREEFELLEKKIVPTTAKYEVVNIPSRHIFANTEWIRKQSELRPVWIICASGRRSQAIKDQYFPRNDGIKSSQSGIKIIYDSEQFDKLIQNHDSTKSVDNKYLRIEYGEGGLGMQQYMQLAFSAMLIVCGGLVYMNVNKNFILVAIVAMIVFVLGQTYTKSCLLGKMIPKSIFVSKTSKTD